MTLILIGENRHGRLINVAIEGPEGVVNIVKTRLGFSVQDSVSFSG